LPPETHVVTAEGRSTRSRPSPSELVRVHSGTVTAGRSPVPRSMTARS
jgi:hypothetical protein